MRQKLYYPKKYQYLQHPILWILQNIITILVKIQSEILAIFWHIHRPAPDSEVH